MIEAAADTVMVTAYASGRSMRTEQRELAAALERHLVEGADFYLGPDLSHLQSVDSIERALADGHHGTVLAVLGEPLPERLRRRHSVFRDLEEVVDRYLNLVD